ncbi:hypothetical protein COOONC_01473, partial [Cooperia oncophora]
VLCHKRCIYSGVHEIATLSESCPPERRRYSDKELVRRCAGAEVIKPQKGFYLTVSSEEVTEEEMNKLCFNAVYMEICIEIKRSNFKRLRCPRLKILRSCRPGRPAFRIVGNRQFRELFIPRSIQTTQYELLFEITENTLLSTTIIEKLRQICKSCNIEAKPSPKPPGEHWPKKPLPDRSPVQPPQEEPAKPKPTKTCQLKAREYDGNDIVRLCAGKQIIKPQKGFTLEVSSTDVNEQEMNDLCANAVYMEICITIENSDFKKLHCPFLEELRPCQKGKPALKIVNNLEFEELVISDTLPIPQKRAHLRNYGKSKSSD